MTLVSIENSVLKFDGSRNKQRHGICIEYSQDGGIDIAQEGHKCTLHCSPQGIPSFFQASTSTADYTQVNDDGTDGSPVV